MLYAVLDCAAIGSREALHAELAARLQLPAAQMTAALERREAIREALAPGFDAVLLDLKDR